MEHRKQLRDEHGVVLPIVGGQGIAHAFWLRAPGYGEIRPATLPEPGRDDLSWQRLRVGSLGRDAAFAEGLGLLVPTDDPAALGTMSVLAGVLSGVAR
jgi:hypothetical protein